MRLCKTLTSKMFWGIIVDILIALVVILLWPVLFAFSSSRSSYLLDKAQEALHVLPHSQPLRPVLHKELSQHESPASTGAELRLPPAAPTPLNNPSLGSALTRKHVVFSFLKKRKRDAHRNTHYQIYWLEYFDLKINKGGKHWSKRRISGFQAAIKQQRIKLKRPACQQGEAQHWELPILCLHHLKRGWEAGIDVSQWTEPYLKAKQVSIHQLNAALISTRAQAQEHVWFHLL